MCCRRRGCRTSGLTRISLDDPMKAASHLITIPQHRGFISLHSLPSITFASRPAASVPSPPLRKIRLPSRPGPLLRVHSLPRAAPGGLRPWTKPQPQPPARPFSSSAMSSLALDPSAHSSAAPTFIPARSSSHGVAFSSPNRNSASPEQPISPPQRKSSKRPVSNTSEGWLAPVEREEGPHRPGPGSDAVPRAATRTPATRTRTARSRPSSAATKPPGSPLRA